MKGKYALLYVVMIVMSLFVTLAVSVFAHFGTLPDRFFLQFLINIPFCLLFGIFDLYIVKRNTMKNNALRIIVNLSLTTSLALFLPSFINYHVSGLLSVQDALKGSILVILWNFMVVLLIEIFHFNLKQIEMEKEKNLYQFESLKSQVNPHFLFNCLNVLSSLAYQDAVKTNLFTKKMSNVYRYLLMTHEYRTIALEEELAFLNSYLYLEQMRFGESLRVIIDNDGRNNYKTVIPVSIQMLVENAIKHNIGTCKSPLCIRIAVDADGVTVNNNLQLRNYVASNGTGLNNLKRQYSWYGYEIDIIKTERDFTVKLPFVEC